MLRLLTIPCTKSTLSGSLCASLEGGFSEFSSSLNQFFKNPHGVRFFLVAAPVFDSSVLAKSIGCRHVGALPPYRDFFFFLMLTSPMHYLSTLPQHWNHLVFFLLASRQHAPLHFGADCCFTAPV